MICGTSLIDLSFYMPQFTYKIYWKVHHLFSNPVLDAWGKISSLMVGTAHEPEYYLLIALLSISMNTKTTRVDHLESTDGQRKTSKYSLPSLKISSICYF